MSSLILLNIYDGVLEIRLDRPSKLNAVTPEMTAEIGAAVEQATQSEAVRCMLITAAGRAFCAGRDLAGSQANEDARAILVEQMNPVIANIYDCPKPTIAAVNGVAMGFGLGLALACDVVFASESAHFAIPFAHLGAALDSGGHFLLLQRLPLGRVLQMVYSAEAVDGRAAAAMGLADHCCPDVELETQSRNFARVCSDGPATALRRQKALCRAVRNMSLSQVLEAEASLQGDLARTNDYREGVSAFQARRKPVFRAT